MRFSKKIIFLSTISLLIPIYFALDNFFKSIDEEENKVEVVTEVPVDTENDIVEFNKVGFNENTKKILNNDAALKNIITENNPNDYGGDVQGESGLINIKEYNVNFDKVYSMSINGSLNNKKLSDYRKYLVGFDLDSTLASLELKSDVVHSIISKHEVMKAITLSVETFNNNIDNLYVKSKKEVIYKVKSDNKYTFKSRPPLKYVDQMDNSLSFRTSTPLSGYKSRPDFPFLHATAASLTTGGSEATNSVPTSPYSSTQECSYNNTDIELNITDVGQVGSKTRINLENLAKKLNYDPITIYSYVKNKIDFDPYFGRVKGLDSVLKTKSGNDFDKAALLVALYRISKIPSRYVMGPVLLDLDDQQVMDWLGVDNAAAAYQLFGSKGQDIPLKRRISLRPNTNSLVIDLMWIEACIPYTNYRGTAEKVVSGGTWASLLPAYNSVIYEKGTVIKGFKFDYTEYENNFENLVVFDDLITQYQEKNSKKIVHSKRILLSDEMDFLPSTLPFKVLSNSKYVDLDDQTVNAYSSEIPEKYKLKLEYKLDYKLNNNIFPLFESEDYISSLSDGLIAIWFDGNSDFRSAIINAAPELCFNTSGATSSKAFITIGIGETKSDNKAKVLSSDYFNMCSKINLTVRTKMNEVTVSNSKFSNLDTFSKYSLVVGSGQSSIHSLEKYKSRITSDYMSSVTSTSTLPSEYLEPGSLTTNYFLHYAGQKYNFYVTETANKIGSLFNARADLNYQIGLASALNKMEYFLDIPLGITGQRFVVDMPGGYITYSDLKGEAVDDGLFDLISYASSAFESYIWQEVALLDAVSTVRGMQKTVADGLSVLDISWLSNAKEQKLTDLSNATKNQCELYRQYNTDEVNQIIDALYAGSTQVSGKIRVPACKVHLSDWLGIVYTSKVSMSNGTSKSGQIISGNYYDNAHGGFSVGTPLDLTIYNETLDVGYQTVYNDLPSMNGIYNDVATSSDIDFSSQDFVLTAAGSSVGFSPTTIVYSGDPVNLLSGNFFTSKKDISLPSRSLLDLQFTRFYNSLLNTDGPLGIGWTHNYNHKIKLLDTNSDNKVDKLLWIDGSFNSHFFNVGSDYTPSMTNYEFDPVNGVEFLLKKSGNSYVVYDDIGMEIYFSSASFYPGNALKVSRISDSNSNYIAFTYTGNDLVKVKNNAGSALDLQYKKSNGKSYISSISTSDGRKYIYDIAVNDKGGFLKSVIKHGEDKPKEVYRYGKFKSREKYALTGISYINGSDFHLNYYANGKVSSHVDPNGNKYLFNYNEFSRETTTTNENGQVEVHKFNKDGLLISKIFPDGTKEDYLYEDSSNPYKETKRVDKNGYSTEYAYNSKGWMVSKKLPNNKFIYYKDHTLLGKPRRIIAQDGAVSVLNYDSVGNLTASILLNKGVNTLKPKSAQISKKTVFDYDVNGNLTLVKRVKNLADDSGPSYKYTYNEFGLVSRMSRCGLQYNDPGALAERCINYTYDYDKYGRPTKLFSSNFYPQTLSYNEEGLLFKQLDSVGNEIRYSYDSSDNLTGEVLTGLDEQGFLSSLISNTYSYDNMNRVIKSHNSSGSPTTYQYDNIGNVIKVSDSTGLSQQFSYDVLNRLVVAKDSRGYQNIYDYDNSDRLISTKYSSGITVNNDYYGSTKLGLLKSSSIADLATLYTYDDAGRVLTKRDHLGATYKYAYDVQGRLVRTVKPSVTTTDYGSISSVIKYTYNNLGFLTSVDEGYGSLTDFRKTRNISTFTYDDFGNVLSEANYLGVTKKYKYDSHFNVISIVKNNDFKAFYSYDHDKGGLLKSVRYISPGVKEDKRDYTYDALGRLVAITDDLHQLVKYTYNKSGLVATEYHSVGNITFSYAYDLKNQLLAVNDSRGRYENYQYDASGNLIGIKNDKAAINFTYDSNGRVTHKFTASGLKVSYDYNEYGLLSNYHYTKGSESILSGELSYSKGLKAVEKLFHENGVSEKHYTYDDLGQLRSSNTDGGLDSYEYDSFGNISRITSQVNPSESVNYIYDNDFISGEKGYLRSIKSSSNNATVLDRFSYDDLGRVTSREGRNNYELAYTASGLVSKVTQEGSLVEENSFGPLGNRIAIKSALDNRHIVYQGNNPWSEASDALGDIKHIYSGLDQLEASSQSNDTYSYFIKDDLSSIVSSFNSSTEQATPVSLYGAWGSGAVTAKHVGYTGREINSIGIYNYRNRYYDPQLGRFLQPDPAGYIDGFNRFSYVGNSPVNFIDPYGLYKGAPSAFEKATQLYSTFNHYVVDPITDFIPGKELFMMSANSVTGNSSYSLGSYGVAAVSVIPAAKLTKKGVDGVQDSLNLIDGAFDVKKSGNKIPNCDLCGPPNKRGNAPIGNDGHPVELHHRNQKPDGPLDEMTRTDHRLGDNFKKNHSNTGQEASQIDRSAWRKEQKDYWKSEWDSGRFDDL